jgi:hypothetical protein
MLNSDSVNIVNADAKLEEPERGSWRLGSVVVTVIKVDPEEAVARLQRIIGVF